MRVFRNILVLVLLLSGCSLAPKYSKQRNVGDYYARKFGPITNAATAIEAIVPLWKQIYGAESITKQKPYKAKLRGDVWIVTGSMPGDKVGGVAMAEISKTEGRVLKISHGR